MKFFIIFQICIIWNIIAIFVVTKTERNGEGYTCAFENVLAGDEAEGLLFFEHYGGLHGADCRTGGSDQELPAACRP